MSDPVQPNAIPLTIIDTYKIKQPFLIPLLPEVFQPLIGRILISWSVFEVMFDDFLGVLKDANNTTLTVSGSSFRKRKQRFRQEMLVAFAEMPDVIRYCNNILEDSESPYMKRNLVAHGRLETSFRTIDDNGSLRSEIRLHCRGQYRGKEIIREFSSDELDDVFYELGHLSGRLNAIKSSAKFPDISSLDKSL